MITELNRSYPTARKEHKCMYCLGSINVGDKYERQTLIYDNHIYDWVCHLECQETTGLLNMFDNDMGEGIDSEHFILSLQDWLYDHHYKEDTDIYDEGFDPDKFSYHDIVLNIIKEIKNKEQLKNL